MKPFRVFSHAMRSLDAKVLAIVGLVILAMTLGSILLFKRLADQAQSLLFDAMDAMSVAVHHGLTAQIYERYFDVRVFSRNPAVQSMKAADIHEVLNEFVSLYGVYDLILVTDNEGRYVASNSQGPKGDALNLLPLRSYDFSAEPWFKAARQGQLFVNEPAVDPYLTMMDGRRAVTNTLATAVVDDAGMVLGVICVRVGVRWIQKELDQGYAMFHAGGFSVARLELINANGERLVEAGAQMTALGARERPAPYPGTADRSRASKIWSLVESEDGNFMIGSSFLPSFPFAPSLGWSLRLTVGSSHASRQLAETVRISYAWILLASIALLGLAVAYLHRLVISRHLQRQVALRTAELQASAHHLEKQNKVLERSQAELVATNHRLIEAQKELLDTAKRLGQSEVAALTLHNIGNIVTSLNIQSTLLREHLEKDVPGELPMALLKKIAQEGRCPEQLPSLISRLEAVEQTTLEQARAVMRGLNDNVRMAMAAISSQLAFVHQSETAAVYKLSELLQHTLILYFGTFKRHHMQQTIRIQHDIQFSTERFLFESILTVLIRNAIDATMDQQDRLISFATERNEQGLALVIQDNGHGFSGDVGARIFRFGFSTKERGHGFGLHYAANSCRHLGLTLSLDSPGPGQGAAARILIPHERILAMMEFVDFPQSGKEDGPDDHDQTGAHAAQNHRGNSAEPGGRHA